MPIARLPLLLTVPPTASHGTESKTGPLANRTPGIAPDYSPTASHIESKTGPLAMDDQAMTPLASSLSTSGPSQPAGGSASSAALMQEDTRAASRSAAMGTVGPAGPLTGHPSAGSSLASASTDVEAKRHTPAMFPDPYVADATRQQYQMDQENAGSDRTSVGKVGPRRAFEGALSASAPPGPLAALNGEIPQPINISKRLPASGGTPGAQVEHITGSHAPTASISKTWPPIVEPKLSSASRAQGQASSTGPDSPYVDIRRGWILGADAASLDGSASDGGSDRAGSLLHTRQTMRQKSQAPKA